MTQRVIASDGISQVMWRSWALLAAAAFASVSVLSLLPRVTFLLVMAILLAGFVHELGHLVMARRLHIPVRRLTFGFGPVLMRKQLPGGAELALHMVPLLMSIGLPGRYTPAGKLRRPVEHDLLVAAAGPVVSVLFALAILGLSPVTQLVPLLGAFLKAAALISAVLAVANLVPLPGLDGGHLLVLGAIRLGLQLSPRNETLIHRIGLRILGVVCVGFIVARLLHIV